MILVNTSRPDSQETIQFTKRLEAQYGKKTVMAVNCKTMDREDVFRIMEQLLADFPITRLNFLLPKWVEFLQPDNWLKQDLIEKCRNVIQKVHTMKDIQDDSIQMQAPYIKRRVHPR